MGMDIINRRNTEHSSSIPFQEIDEEIPSESQETNIRSPPATRETEAANSSPIIVVSSAQNNSTDHINQGDAQYTHSLNSTSSSHHTPRERVITEGMSYAAPLRRVVTLASTTSPVSRTMSEEARAAPMLTRVDAVSSDEVSVRNSFSMTSSSNTLAQSGHNQIPAVCPNCETNAHVVPTNRVGQFACHNCGSTNIYTTAALPPSSSAESNLQAPLQIGSLASPASPLISIPGNSPAPFRPSSALPSSYRIASSLQRPPPAAAPRRPPPPSATGGGGVQSSSSASVRVEESSTATIGAAADGVGPRERVASTFGFRGILGSGLPTFAPRVASPSNNNNNNNNNGNSQSFLEPPPLFASKNSPLPFSHNATASPRPASPFQRPLLSSRAESVSSQRATPAVLNAFSLTPRNSLSTPRSQSRARLPVPTTSASPSCLAPVSQRTEGTPSNRQQNSNNMFSYTGVLNESSSSSSSSSSKHSPPSLPLASPPIPSFSLASSTSANARQRPSPSSPRGMSTVLPVPFNSATDANCDPLRTPRVASPRSQIASPKVYTMGSALGGTKSGSSSLVNQMDSNSGLDKLMSRLVGGKNSSSSLASRKL
eukprot:GDKK01056406.1.p1 GENE.GDKK01056406.1~~GDKK01056406.1.p1  ORF type:complete len:599 (-),score=180.46 GDKK01056406.1:950-2746(-)